MTHEEIRDKFLNFFEERGHKIVPSSSLLPTDPSVLFTTAGMQQFKPYFLGDADPMKDFGSRRTASIQKAMRTSDIDEVGDKSHLTFFEMLGHFSFGDYFKKETIEWTYEFLTDVLKISKDRISATVFAGDDKIPFDSESYDAWSSFLPADRIRKGPREDNVWGPPGPEGPCGAANEVYVDDLEVATLVFMEYNCDKDQNLTPLPQRGVDVGWGFERVAMISQEKSNIFETDLFEPLIQLLPGEMDAKTQRIIADHSRAAAFLISDGVVPSNKEQGYVLRRLLRRIIVHSHNFGLELDAVREILGTIAGNYGKVYPELDKEKIISEFNKENDKFTKGLKVGLKKLEEFLLSNNKGSGFVKKGENTFLQYTYDNTILGKFLFQVYQEYGFPLELSLEHLKSKGLDIPKESLEEIKEVFNKEFMEHQEISRAGVEKKFGGHGIKEGDLTAADAEEMKKKTRLHTATHVIVAALQQVLGQKLPQAGSDITAERLRFDFTFPRKVTPEELKQAEDIANKVTREDLPVTWKEMDLREALDSGASAFFKLKYPPRVKVYTIGDENHPFSRELCGGPHVSHTGEIGKITITKEESVSGGRRIRAVVE